MKVETIDLIACNVSRDRLHVACAALARVSQGTPDGAYKAMCRAFTRRWHTRSDLPHELTRAARRYVDAIIAQCEFAPVVDLDAHAKQVLELALRAPDTPR